MQQGTVWFSRWARSHRSLFGNPEFFQSSSASSASTLIICLTRIFKFLHISSCRPPPLILCLQKPFVPYTITELVLCNMCSVGVASDLPKSSFLCIIHLWHETKQQNFPKMSHVGHFGISVKTNSFHPKWISNKSKDSMLTFSEICALICIQEFVQNSKCWGLTLINY